MSFSFMVTSYTLLQVSLIQFFWTTFVVLFAAMSANAQTHNSTLGAYQVYKTRDLLWIYIDEDIVVERNGYAEPPTIESPLSCHMFCIDKRGAINQWKFTREKSSWVSANNGFTYLVALSNEVYLVSYLETHAFQLTSNKKPVNRPIACTKEDLCAIAKIPTDTAENALRYEKRLMDVSFTAGFIRTRSDIYEMGVEEENLPKDLVPIDLSFQRRPAGMGYSRVVANSSVSSSKWSKVLIAIKNRE